MNRLWGSLRHPLFGRKTNQDPHFQPTLGTDNLEFVCGNRTQRLSNSCHDRSQCLKSILSRSYYENCQGKLIKVLLKL